MTPGILTYQNQLNYGGVLQAYALQETVRDIYPTCQLINFKCSMELTSLGTELAKSLLSFWKRGSQKRLWLHATYISEVYAHNLRVNRTRNFLNTRIRQSVKEYPNAAALSSLSEFDVVIVGSDQVWKYSSPNFDACLLSTLPNSITRIAYAASLGTNEIPAEFTSKFSEALKKFKLVSVREPSSIKLLRPLLPPEIPIEWTTDPTILLPRSHWIRLAGGLNRDEKPYAFLYWLGDISFLPMIVDGLRESGYKRIRFFFSWYQFALTEKPAKTRWLQKFLKKENVECCFDAGPEEFVSGIAHADYVVSDSFHALMFSSTFEKPFRIFINSSDKRRGSANRIHDFAEKFGLSSGVTDSIDAGFSSPAIDYTNVWTLLKPECDRSRELLYKTLKNLK
jgi:polysaccharide pyruvyl transferase WcaK-like protein